TDGPATEAADAAAFTRGNEITFAPGRFQPQSLEGRRLIFHELTHVLQQRRPGPTASEALLEREADRVAELALAGRRAPVLLAASHGSRQNQQASWATGDVWVDAEATNQIKNQGGLFSGGDQAFVNVSNRGKLAYDSSHSAPEDPFRWSKLKDIVDGAHLKIYAVSDQQKFKVQETPNAPPVDRSISEIRMLVGDLSVMGITLSVGGQSPDPTYDQIYYDKNQGIGALSHELFGHEWLSVKGVPSVHPPAGSAAEKTRGTLLPSHGVTDPFGNVFSGTVRAYISKYVESLGTNVTVNTAAGGQRSVPKSPTQQVGVDAVNKAFGDLHTNAASGLTKTTYNAAMAQAWRILGDNYDLMQTHAESEKAGNWNFTYTKEIILVLSYLLFNSWTPGQKSGFRILLADFTGSRAGFSVNELSSKLEAIVGAAPSPFNPTPSSMP
ncbi:MAG: DUF4157 domain-containing protein, partial [Acidobacteria bacterium]|nr:DUF4157 domain-containing protein [Acidobacteriota bacterium]